MSRSTLLRLPLAAFVILLLALSGIAVAQDGDGSDPAADAAPSTDDSAEESSDAGDEAADDEAADDEAADDEAADDEADEDDEAAGDEAAEDEDDEDSDEDDESDEEDEDDGDRGNNGAVTGGRVFGPDRLSTAVAISRYEFPNGSREAYLARADNFADAVAAGALARGPVLLVPDCGEIPVIVSDELARLRPRKVVALGGPAAVCDEMLRQAVQAAQGGRSDGNQRPDDLDDNERDEPRTEETQVLDLAVGDEATIEVDGGTATIGRTDDGVVLVDAVAIDDTWRVETSSDDDEVEVSFRNDDVRIDVRAELEDGQVEVRIRTRRR